MIPQPFPPAEPEAERVRNPPLRRPGQYALRVANIVAKGRAAHDAGLPRTAMPYSARCPDLQRHWYAGWDAAFCEQIAKAPPPHRPQGRVRRPRR